MKQHNSLITTICIGALCACFGCAKLKPRNQDRKAEVPTNGQRLEFRAKLDPALLDYMDKAAEAEFIPIVIIMERQLTEDEKAQVFAGVRGDNPIEMKRQKRKVLVDAL